MVVAGLVWWGREVNRPLAGEAALGPPRPLRSEAVSKVRSAPPPGQSAAVPLTAAGDADDPSLPAVLSRSFLVRPGDDLLSVIASAPARSTITLIDDGPYRLGGRTLGSRGPLALLNRDITIKADPQFRPVLAFAADASQQDGAPTALLTFTGGSITLKGLTFELEHEGSEASVSAISTEDTDLTIRGCLFRQAAVHSERNRAAIRTSTIKSSLDAGDHPPRVFADACHFDGGQISIISAGPGRHLAPQLHTRARLANDLDQ